MCRNKEIFLDGRSLSNIIFIAANTKDICLIHQNAIVVRPYYGNKYENTLAKLKIYILKHLLDSRDVREVIKRDFINKLSKPSAVSFNDVVDALG